LPQHYQLHCLIVGEGIAPPQRADGVGWLVDFFHGGSGCLHSSCALFCIMGKPVSINCRMLDEQ